MSELLDAALRYALIGWRVFPLVPGQKTPITAHGCKDATNDPEQIQKWWAAMPNANIGLACGEASGVYVIDVDKKNNVDGLESLSEFPDLPHTLFQTTPSGGFHAFYRTDNPPANKNGFRPGIDIRGHNYYVVLAPSIHPNGGRYAWVPGFGPWERSLAEYPDFMRPAARAPQAAVLSPPSALPQPVPGPASADVLEIARRYLAKCDPAIQGQGGHNRLLWVAGAMTWGLGLSDAQAYDILAREYNPRCVPPWNLAEPKDEKDFRRKIGESRKHPPSKPQFWIRDDPAYAPIAPEYQISKEDIQALIDHAKRKQVVRAAQWQTETHVAGSQAGRKVVA